MNSIAQWLSAIGLERYTAAFSENDIDFDLLAQVDDQLLKDIGIASAGHRLRLRNEIQKLLTGSSAPEITQSATEDPTSVADAAGERRQITVMFCDMVGSTALSSQLDPEEFRELVRGYHERCARVIRHFEGYIAQYLGDGLLVYFGHPRAHEDDAARAVRAGLAILTAMQEFNASRPLPLSLRIGVHSGLVVLGRVGSGERQETLALGDTPNMAARLQALASPDTLLISEATHRLVEGLFDLQALGRQTLKGITDAMRAYRVLTPREARDRIDVRSRLWNLVGRDQELALLTDRWERALEGHGQVVLLVGEPGIGKSRIVRALDETLANVAHYRVELRCSPLYSQTPLYPFVERLAQRLGWEPGDDHSTEMEKLEATLEQFGVTPEESLPLLAVLLSRSPPGHYPLPAMTPQRQRRRTLETLVSLLGGMASDRPVLLVVEDLHWADPSTLELIGHHIDQAPTTRMLLVLTARPGFQAPWGARSYLTPLLLNRLTLKQTQSFVAQLTLGKRLPDEVLRPIVQKTDGVPLFVEELTKSVLEARWLIDKGDHYALDGQLPELAIPATLQDSLMARLDRLSRGRDIAQLAAALGRNFSFELISAVAGRDPASLSADLDELVSAEFLFQKGFGAQASYMFKHALILDTAYQSLLKSRRQHIHRTVADPLVSRFSLRRAGCAIHARRHQHAVRLLSQPGATGTNGDRVPDAGLEGLREIRCRILQTLVSCATGRGLPASRRLCAGAGRHCPRHGHIRKEWRTPPRCRVASRARRTAAGERSGRASS